MPGRQSYYNGNGIPQERQVVGNKNQQQMTESFLFFSLIFLQSEKQDSKFQKSIFFSRTQKSDITPPGVQMTKGKPWCCCTHVHTQHPSDTSLGETGQGLPHFTWRNSKLKVTTVCNLTLPNMIPVIICYL